MNIQVHGDGKGFKVHVEGTWRAIMAFIAALALLVPAITHLGSILGWW